MSIQVGGTFLGNVYVSYEYEVDVSTIVYVSFVLWVAASGLYRVMDCFFRIEVTCEVEGTCFVFPEIYPVPVRVVCSIFKLKQNCWCDKKVDLFSASWRILRSNSVKFLNPCPKDKISICWSCILKGIYRSFYACVPFGKIEC